MIQECGHGARQVRWFVEWARSVSRSAGTLATATLVFGCAGDVELPLATEDCSVGARKQFVGSLMRDYYLWYDKIPDSIDYDSADSPEALMSAMTYRELDRWSGMQELVQRNQYFGEGRYQGFGYTLGVDINGELRISWSHEGSAAGRANFQRGEELVAVNGRTVSELTGQELGAELARDVVSHTLVGLSGEERTETLEQGNVDITSVKSTTVLDTPQGKLGYLMFTTFVNPLMRSCELRLRSLRKRVLTSW